MEGSLVLGARVLKLFLKGDYIFVSGVPTPLIRCLPRVPTGA